MDEKSPHSFKLWRNLYISQFQKCSVSQGASTPGTTSEWNSYLFNIRLLRGSKPVLCNVGCLCPEDKISIVDEKTELHCEVTKWRSAAKNCYSSYRLLSVGIICQTPKSDLVCNAYIIITFRLSLKHWKAMLVFLSKHVQPGWHKQAIEREKNKLNSGATKEP